MSLSTTLSNGDDIRPKWWTIIVGIMWIVLPSVMVLMFFLFPEKSFLPESNPNIQDEEQAVIFKNVARSNACGDTLAIFLCIILLKTRTIEIMEVCAWSLTLWSSLLNLMTVVEYIEIGYLSNITDSTIICFDLLMMVYILCRIHRYKTNETREFTGINEATRLV